MGLWWIKYVHVFCKLRAFAPRTYGHDYIRCVFVCVIFNLWFINGLYELSFMISFWQLFLGGFPTIPIRSQTDRTAINHVLFKLILSCGSVSLILYAKLHATQNISMNLWDYLGNYLRIVRRIIARFDIIEEVYFSCTNIGASPFRN